jgi:hypothetical protein
MRKGLQSLVAIVLIAFLARDTHPCPFCSALSSTLTEDLRAVQFAFFARCTHAADVTHPTTAPIHSFRLIEELALPQLPIANSAVIAKQELVIAKPTALVAASKVHIDEHTARRDQSVTVYSLREYQVGDVVLVQGTVQGGSLDWSATETLTTTGQDYLRRLTHPTHSNPVDRLRFCLGHLGSKDKFVATDAYNEFALASLETMCHIKSDLNRQAIKKLLEDSTYSSELRRLNWTLLSICGDLNDVPFVEQQLRQAQEATSADIGWDAVFSCYLVLGGEKALQSLEKEFLLNEDASYASCFALITAMRVHAEQFQKIPAERITAGFHLALSQPRLAELVIPDLARWNDWTAIDQLVRLYLQPNADNYQHHKIPIVNYLRACPWESAKIALAKCERADPEPIRRAQVFFPSR